MTRLIPLFERAGVRVVFSGHEHNFQHSRVDGIDYFVTGAAGKFRAAVPDEFEAAQTRSWSSECHFLLARITDRQMTVRAIGGRTPGPSQLNDISRRTPAGEILTGPMQIDLARP
jgi:hypothetical protein